MTSRDELVQDLVDLVEGRLDPVQWDAWWAAHGEEFLQLLNPGQALRFRMAIRNESPMTRIEQSQAQSAEILRSWNVEVTLDSSYAAAARREREEAWRAIQQQARNETAARSADLARF